jgi:hypothetical protein
VKKENVEMVSYPTSEAVIEKERKKERKERKGKGRNEKRKKPI